MTTLTTRSTKRRNQMMKALDPKYAARTEARARPDDATKAVERAKRIEAVAADVVRSLEERAAQAESALGEQLALAIAQGGPSADLPTVADDGLGLALTAARSDLSIKTQAVARLAASHAEGQTELAAAERAVVQAVDAMLNQEREAIAARCIEIFEKLTLKIAQLRSLVPDELNTPRHLTLNLSSSVMQALNLVPPPDATRIPVNVLRFGTAGNREAWATRRARLIAGEASEEASAA